MLGDEDMPYDFAGFGFVMITLTQKRNFCGCEYYITSPRWHGADSWNIFFLVEEQDLPAIHNQ